MNYNHDDGCGAQKSVRCGDVVFSRLADSHLVKQTDFMVCDACGDIWTVVTKFDPKKDGLTMEDFLPDEG